MSVLPVFAAMTFGHFICERGAPSETAAPPLMSSADTLEAARGGSRFSFAVDFC